MGRGSDTFTPGEIERWGIYAFRYGWQTRLAEAIGRSDRMVRYYLSGHCRMPPKLADILADAAAERHEREGAWENGSYLHNVELTGSARQRERLLAKRLTRGTIRQIDRQLQAAGLLPRLRSRAYAQISRREAAYATEYQPDPDDAITPAGAPAPASRD